MARVVYDLLFFFVVIIIVLNLIFGVIIDTFADLRSEKQNKEEILKNTCFICGEYPGEVEIRNRIAFCHSRPSTLPLYRFRPFSDHEPTVSNHSTLGKSCPKNLIDFGI